jgi:radical SAM enzyme (TIGR01210 family)
MNDQEEIAITDKWIISRRGRKNHVDPLKPYAWLVEKELTPSGRIEDVGVVFLTNRECPFHCLMCDLWKNTTDETVPPGTIAGQIEWALSQMSGIEHIKLYNSGSFFDNRAIPEEDYNKIAELVRELKTVIVESHPVFINEKCLSFRDMLKPDLQLAVGLETVNPEILRKLNKKMAPQDFRSSIGFLTANGITTRAFILLKPPFMSEGEGVFWAERSIDFAFDSGAECCVVIPVRAGNGAMDELAEKDLFSPPDVKSLEKVVEYGISLKAGRVFADTWDLKLFSKCDRCIGQRIARLTEMNLSQKVVGPVSCKCD